MEIAAGAGTKSIVKMADTAEIQDGSGSFLGRIKRMNKLGLSPKKPIPIEIDEEEEEYDDTKKT